MDRRGAEEILHKNSGLTLEGGLGAVTLDETTYVGQTLRLVLVQSTNCVTILESCKNCFRLNRHNSFENHKARTHVILQKKKKNLVLLMLT